VVKGARIVLGQGKVVQKSFAYRPWARIGGTPAITVVVVPAG
jgi:hypothetical protein